MNKIIVEHLSEKAINTLRDTAIKIEKEDISVAKELMNLAHIMRPKGEKIKKKLDDYNFELNLTDAEKTLRSMVDSGEIAIIPIGFRCHTKMEIRKKLKISQSSLPFDSGFFSPFSIESVMRNPEVRLGFSNDLLVNHNVCKKIEPFLFNEKKGIKFENSSYEEINLLATDPNMLNINKYLDSTFGYYTLDTKHKFVLAHYNWHKFSSNNKSNGVIDPKVNLKNVSDVLNRRIKKMFDLCEKADFIFFLYNEDQGFDFMLIEDEYHNLHDYSAVKEYLESKYNNKAVVGDLKEYYDAEKILEKVKEALKKSLPSAIIRLSSTA